MEKLLLHLGFTRSHPKGSHVFYRHPDGRTTTVPHHPGRVLAITLIRKIMRDIEISVEDYNKALREI
jgi:predicted RNA binding protein YcfA (HicA-like mRNA interferase family)